MTITSIIRIGAWQAGLLGLATAIVALLVAFLPAIASAAPPELWQKCDSDEPAGERCLRPRGVAADPATGHVFVADQANQRVVEFDALGLLVRAWGWDVVASGPGNQSSAPEPAEFEICVPDNGDICKEGVGGAGAGAFSNPLGVALDSAGSLYVADFSNRRVQKFSPTGGFLLMFGGEVNKTTTADICTKEDLEGGDECGAGTTGSAVGEFGEWGIGDFIAIDSTDDVYVGDVGRVQRFDVAGSYQDECSVPGKVQSLASDSSGNLYAAYESQLDVRKLSFVAGGECEELLRFEIPRLTTFESPVSTAVAVDAAGHVFVFGPTIGNVCSGCTRDPIIEFDPAGNVLDEFGEGEFEASHGLATNLCAGSEAPGNLYVTNLSTTNSFLRAYGTEPIGCFKARTLPATNVTETSATLNGTVNPDGALTSECRFEWGTTTAYGNLAPCAESPAAIGEGGDPVPVHADIGGLDAATVYHVRLRARIGGETETGPDVAFKTLGPPVISDEHTVAATDTEAIVKALVNPEGFPTSCRVDYGTGETFSQSSEEVEVGDDRTEHATTAVLTSLVPGTTYRWRFVCDNTAVLAGGETTGAGGTLTTYRTFLADTDCPNQAFRGGDSANLPDCRAYEMVSPVDKNGADIISGLSGARDPGGYVQAAPDGDRLTYTTKGPPAFGDAPNSFKLNQYLGTRQERGEAEEGWSSEGIHPPFLGDRIPGKVPGAFREFIAFSPSLCSAWLIDFQTPALNPDGQEEAANLYRRQNCDPDKGSFETVTDVLLTLEGEARSSYVDNKAVQGVSADSRHAIFVAKAQLTPDAAAAANAQLYDRFGGVIHLVSVLPNASAGDPNPGDGMGFANPSAAAAGSGWNNNLQGAVSTDGSAVYWTSGASEGRIFLRLHPEQGVVAGECSDPSVACTIAVSENLTTPFSNDAFFWAASPDGSAALYSEAGDLYRFDLASEESQLVAEDVMGVAGASEDLSRVYLVSREVMPESGQNSEEAEAIDGEPNLYLAQGGAFTFVATLAEGDVGQIEPGSNFAPYNLVDRGTYNRATRVSPDGGKLAFQSRAGLSEFDNTAANGAPAVEVYAYEAGADELTCVSCNPSGARAAVAEMTPPYTPKWPHPSEVFAAAWIPTPEHPLHASGLLSEDGQRLFFNSHDALVPRDTNGAQDVYEWEAAGTGSCDSEDASYFPQNGGCLYLISNGENGFRSEFWEASADGTDAFFTTEASLLPQDPGLVDLYDARVGGGFAQPVPRSSCEGEACQSPPPPPEFDQPASSTYNGPGNVAAARSCRAPARRAAKLSRRAKAARRAAKRADRAASGRLSRRARRLAGGARKARRAAKRCRSANRRGQR